MKILDVLKRKEFRFLGMFVFILALSTWSPTDSFVGLPKYWWDESFTIENARTMLELGGRPDFIVEPNTPTMSPVLVHANGFPLVFSIATFFWLFDIGLVQARIFMIFWIFATSVSLFYILKSFFNSYAAYAGTLLVTTFAPFYANGRTATGDIPGFFFLLWALWLIIKKEKYFIGGIVLGLAAVTKISVFHMVLPAMAISIVLAKGKAGIRPLIHIVLGAITVGIIWWILMFPSPLNLDEISKTLEFFKDPYHKPSLIDRLPGSLIEFLTSSTGFYFVGLLSLILVSIKKTTLSDKEKLLYLFSGIYILLQFYVYFKSPGWNRYLIISQLLILSLFYPSISKIIPNKKIVLSIVTFLVALQVFQYIYLSNIFAIEEPTRNADAIIKLLEEDTTSTVGFIDDPMDAALIPSDRKYQQVHVGGQTYIGTHPLDHEESSLPTYVFSRSTVDHPNISLYEKIEISSGVSIWRKKD